MKPHKEKRCTRCNETKPLLPEFWQRNRASKDGFRNPCKICSNELDRIKRAKKSGAISRKKPDNPDGLKINIQVDYGKRYEVLTPKTSDDKEDETFIGILIQETADLIVLQNDIGYCESFTKINISLGIHDLKEED